MDKDKDEKRVRGLAQTARRVRRKVVELAHSAGYKGSHLGGSLSCVEIYTVLYNDVMRFDRQHPAWDGRDRMIAGKEHGRLAEYAAMAEAGLIAPQDLYTYMQNGGKLAGHPRNPDLGLEYSCCSLGMALPVAVGMALAAKRTGREHSVYMVMGDGELNEGSMWEAFLCAAHYRLDNLVAVIDRNHLSSDGDTEEIMALGDLREKLEAFGWQCRETADGNDVGELLDAFQDRMPGKPYVIIANTVKGKGLSFAENSAEWHRGVLTDALYERALLELAEPGGTDEGTYDGRNDRTNEGDTDAD